MKAIQFEQYGEPAKVFAVQERPIPEPGKGEVRVRILASPVNPSDLLFVRGHYAGVQPHFPSPAGFEGVGIVDVLGPQVHRPMPGQRVAVINAEKAGGTANSRKLWIKHSAIHSLTHLSRKDRDANSNQGR
jgi:NADPH:quinone reductase